MSKPTKSTKTTKPAKSTKATKGVKRLTVEDVKTPKAGFWDWGSGGGGGFYADYSFGPVVGGADDACKNPAKEETCKNR